MEEEIDLRPYIETIIKHWYWIVAAAILAGLVAFGVTSLQPSSYEATALVTITLPQELTLTSLTGGKLDPSFVSKSEALPYLRAFPELATSDQLLQDLLQTLDPPLVDTISVEELRDMLVAEAGNDPTLIRLTATYDDPETVTQIVNQWAALYVPWANNVYEASGEDQVAFLETQLSTIKSDLETAEEALITFEANNRAPLLRNTSTFLTQKQATLLSEQNDLLTLTQDVQALQTQVESLPRNTPIPLAHQLTALNLQLQAFGVAENTPLQLQLEPTSALTGVDRATQLAFLDGLLDTLIARSAQLEMDLAQLEPQILTVQQQLQEAETQRTRLSRNYDEVEEIYTALARKTESERISAENTNTGVRLASNSAVPVEPSGSGRLLPTLVAAILGGLTAVTILLFREWQRSWKQDQS